MTAENIVVLGLVLITGVFLVVVQLKSRRNARANSAASTQPALPADQRQAPTGRKGD